MTKAQRAQIESYGAPGSRITFKLKGTSGARSVGIVEDRVYVIVQDYQHFIQRIKLDSPEENDASTYAYRIGYYTWSGNGDRVIFGQYNSLVSERQLTDLLCLAASKGWPVIPPR
jgi:hypothetical protein